MIRLLVFEPEQLVFEGNVYKVTLPGSSGTFQVLQDHAPLVSTLRSGIVLYEDEKKVNTLAIVGGWVEVLNNCITVLTTAAICSQCEEK